MRKIKQSIILDRINTKNNKNNKNTKNNKK